MTYNGGNSLNTSEQATGKTPIGIADAGSQQPDAAGLDWRTPIRAVHVFPKYRAHRKGGDPPRFPGYTGNIGE